MESVIFTVLITIWIVVMTVLRRMSRGSNASDKNRSSSGKSWHTEHIPGTSFGKRAPRSTDGHILGKGQDITCRQFGHNHPESEEPSARYIVHDDPEEGYIILNGVKMLRTEADAYENRI